MSDLNLPIEALKMVYGILTLVLIYHAVIGVKYTYFYKPSICTHQYDYKNKIIQGAVMLVIEALFSSKRVSPKLMYMATAATQRMIEKDEVEELEELEYKNLLMLNSLYEALLKPCSLDDELKQMCKNRITELSTQCQQDIECLKKVDCTCKQLSPIVQATQEGMTTLAQVDLSSDNLEKNYDAVKDSVGYILDEIFAVEFYKFTYFLALNQFEIMNDVVNSAVPLTTTDSASRNEILMQELIKGMTLFASMELNEFKGHVQESLLALQEFKDQTD